MPSSSPLARSTEQARRQAIQHNVESVVLGNLLIKPWYPSFYPNELVGKKIERLYVCQWCFRYCKEPVPFVAHSRVCPLKDAEPPGRVIYSKGAVSIYEVDGEEEKLYTQNLSLFSKLFLDNKSVFYDVATFRYYLMAFYDPISAQRQVVGFFSKEKMSWDNNNVACILVFPPWQRRGLGQILMGVSYELSRREGKLGGPEKPLSSLGHKGYLAYWSTAIARVLLTTSVKKVSIADVVRATWIPAEDVMTALLAMDVLESSTQSSGQAIVSKDRVESWASRNKTPKQPVVDPAAFRRDPM